MNLKVKAIYRDGAFVPQSACAVPEGSEVDLLVQTSEREVNPDIRAQRMKALTDRMRRNPIPGDAPRWTREELHERR